MRSGAVPARGGTAKVSASKIIIDSKRTSGTEMCQRFFRGKTDSAEENSSVRNSSQIGNLNSELYKQKTLVNIQFTRVFGTPDWIRTSGLQSRSYQAVNAGALMPQGFQWFRTNAEGKWSKAGSHCAAMAPGFFRIIENSSQIVVKGLKSCAP